MSFTDIMSDILLANNTFFDKLEAHKRGLKHYAFSLFLFNKNGEMLIQKRALTKYHSGGFWSNACCSHFRDKNEFQNKENTAKNRLEEEIGIDFQEDLKFVDVFEYCENVGNGLIENEIDYIFTGLIDDDTNFELNKNEVECVKFVSIDELKQDVLKNAHKYTIWFHLILENQILLNKICNSIIKI